MSDTTRFDYECRSEPPTRTIEDGKPNRVWPPVCLNDWCGRFWPIDDDDSIRKCSYCRHINPRRGGRP